MLFNEVAATQAAIYLLRIAGGQMSYTKLIRLLYLADRKSLLEHGSTISTDSYAMTARGPVLENVLARATSAASAERTFWSDSITRASVNEVALTFNADEGELPAEQTDILDEVFERYRGANLGHVLAALPECRGRQQGSIQVADILRAA